MINFFKKKYDSLKRFFNIFHKIKNMEASINELISVVNQQQVIVLNLSRLNLENTCKVAEIENIIYSVDDKVSNSIEDISLFYLEDDDFIN